MPISFGGSVTGLPQQSGYYWLEQDSKWYPIRDVDGTTAAPTVAAPTTAPNRVAYGSPAQPASPALTLTITTSGLEIRAS